MTKRCRRCGFENDDSHFFCQQCGEALDDNVRLIMNYEKMKKTSTPSKQTVSRNDQDDDFVPVKREEKKKSYAALWALLAALVVAAGIGIYFWLAH